jgi:hypothetical protein
VEIDEGKKQTIKQTIKPFQNKGVKVKKGEK